MASNSESCSGHRLEGQLLTEWSILNFELRRPHEIMPLLKDITILFYEHRNWQ